MRNLLKETILDILAVNKEISDITFIGSKTGVYGCTWTQYEKIADIAYDSSYGSTQIAQDLIILFNDGTWLSREEYDGSEWWRYNKPPKIGRASCRERVF